MSSSQVALRLEVDSNGIPRELIVNEKISSIHGPGGKTMPVQEHPKEYAKYVAAIIRSGDLTAPIDLKATFEKPLDAWIKETKTMVSVVNKF